MNCEVRDKETKNEICKDILKKVFPSNFMFCYFTFIRIQFKVCYTVLFSICFHWSSTCLLISHNRFIQFFLNFQFNLSYRDNHHWNIKLQNAMLRENKDFTHSKINVSSFESIKFMLGKCMYQNSLSNIAYFSTQE